MRSGISPAGKDKCCRFHSRGTSSSPVQEDGTWNGVSRHERSEEELFNGEGVAVLQGKNIETSAAQQGEYGSHTELFS